MSQELQFKILEDFLRYFLLDEKDNRTEETHDYKPKGFAEETVLSKSQKITW